MTEMCVYDWWLSHPCRRCRRTLETVRQCAWFQMFMNHEW